MARIFLKKKTLKKKGTERKEYEGVQCKVRPHEGLVFHHRPRETPSPLRLQF